MLFHSFYGDMELFFLLYDLDIIHLVCFGFKEKKKILTDVKF